MSLPNFDHWWPSYLTQARDKNYSEAQIATLRAYSSKLLANGVPIIFDARHLSLLLGYEIDFLFSISNSQIGNYRKFEIPKRRGGVREIHEPLPNLKEIQSWVLRNILNALPVSPAAKAFRIGGSTKLAAKFHCRQAKVMRLDIRNFFPSISEKLVFRIFYDLGYTKQIAVLLTKLCTLGGSLPQGAPSSPALSNAVMKEFDTKFLVLVKEMGIRYTRYADDLYFSGDFPVKQVIKAVRGELGAMELQLNEAKTKVMRQGGRQAVTGIVVNSKMNTPRELRRDFRKNVYYVRQYGVDGHLRELGETRANYLEHLLGIAAYIRTFDNSPRMIADTTFLRSLKREYQRQ